MRRCSISKASTRSPELICKPAVLLHEPGAQSSKLNVADRSCRFHPIELFDFICDAETHDAPELITRLLSLMHIALGHASSLKDQICKHAEIRKNYPSYHPDRLDPA